MPTGAIFDLDGTLVTFGFDIRGARHALIEDLGRRGFDISSLDPAAPTQRLLDAAREQALPRDGPRFREARRSAFDILDRYEVEGVGSTQILPGARETLSLLQKRGVRLAVLTNSGRTAATAELEKAGLGGFFEFVLTRDETVLMKPRPEGVAMAASRLGLARESTYYVGDSPYDVQAAKAAGIMVIGVATGNNTVARLRSEGADYAVPSVADLAPILCGGDK